MPELGKAFVQIVPSAEGISGSITEVLSGEASSAGEASGGLFSDKFVSMAKTALAAAGIGAAITAAIGKVGDLAEFGDTIDKQSQKIGISAKAYQEWDAVLQHSGSSIGSMQGAMKKLTSAAASGSDAFEKLGISQEQALSMSQEDLFATVITGLQGMEAGTERTALAQELLGKSAQDMAALLNTSAEETQAMKDRVNELGGVMSDDAVKAAAGYQDALQDMKTAMSGFTRGILAEFLPGFTEVMDGITSIFSGEEGGVEKVMQGVADIGQALIDGIPTLAQNAAEMVLGVVTAIGEHLPEMAQTGMEMVTNAATGFLEGLPEMITSAGQLVTDVLSYLLENMPQMMEQGFQMVVNIAQGIVNNLPAVVTSIAQVIASILATIGEHLPEILQKGLELLGQLLAGIINAIPQIPGTIAQVIENIKSVFSEFDWPSIGGNLIDGIKNGITSAASKIKDAALEAAKAAFQAVKDFFGIKSPSTLMRDQIGKFIPAGMAEGIENNLGLVTDAMDDLSTAATGAIAANINGSMSYSGRSGGAIGGTVINVYGAPGQDERIIAERVAEILNHQIMERRAVYA